MKFLENSLNFMKKNERFNKSLRHFFDALYDRKLRNEIECNFIKTIMNFSLKFKI